MRISLGLLVGAVVALAVPSFASDIGYRVFRNGGLAASGTVHVNDPPFSSSNPGPTDIEIPAGDPDNGNNISNSTDVHIFTDNATALAVVGRITLSGHENTAQVVRVLIGHKSLSDLQTTDLAGFFQDQSAFVTAGLRDLGGFECAAPATGDLSLSDKTALSATVTGDITGLLKSGMLFRVHAQRSADDSFGGTISGSLEATQGNGDAFGLDGHTYPAIGYVRAGWQITGDIKADGRQDASGNSLFNPGVYETWGSMPHIVVFHEGSTPPGLLGNIHCENGDIGEILANGQIGTSTTIRSSILAGVRIGRISTRDFSTGAMVALPAYADIDASTKNIQPPGVLPGLQSSLSLVEVGSDYWGSIRVLDVNGEFDMPGPSRPTTLRKGIFVDGAFHGNILSEYSWHDADMIARSFRGSITIRQQLRGAIVAVGYDPTLSNYPGPDDLDGTIPSVIVGFNSDGTDSTDGDENGHFPMSAAPPLPSGEVYERGFCGAAGPDIASPPFEGPQREDTTYGWYNQVAHPSDAGSVDSVIRAAKSLDLVQLYSMSDQLDKDAAARPRVESPVIKQLLISYFDFGTVWSGLLNSATTSTTNQIKDDYASVNILVIGCVGPKADLWVRDCPVLEVTGDMWGEIHLPSLKANEMIRISGRFGNTKEVEFENTAATLCGTETDDSQNIRFREIVPDEWHSPRGLWFDTPTQHTLDHDSDEYNNDVDLLKPRPAFATILMREVGGMRGQITLDNLNPTSQPRTRNYRIADPPPESYDGTAYWLGNVEVGTGQINVELPSSSPFKLSTYQTRASDPNRTWAHDALDLPDYANGPGKLGGGSVGMVPFDMYHQACVPESDCPFGDGCNRLWTNQVGIDIPFNFTVPAFSADHFRANGLSLVFRGYVALGSTNSADQRFHLYICNDYGVPDTTVDYGTNANLDVSVQPNPQAPFSRTVIVKLRSGGSFPAPDTAHPASVRCVLQRYASGTYHGLVCDGITRTNIPVNLFNYNFSVSLTDGIDPPDLRCGSADFNCDGDVGTDADITAFFACLSGGCPPAPCASTADFNGDGDVGTDQDIEAFFRVLGGGHC